MNGFLNHKKKWTTVETVIMAKNPEFYSSLHVKQILKSLGEIFSLNMKNTKSIRWQKQLLNSLFFKLKFVKLKIVKPILYWNTQTIILSTRMLKKHI